MQLKKWKTFSSVMDDSAIMCDEIIDTKAESNNEEKKTIPTNSNEKNITYKTQNIYTLLALL